MYFSKNSKTFCLFFIAFLESKVNFKHLEKKNEPHSPGISEVIDSERRVT